MMIKNVSHSHFILVVTLLVFVIGCSSTSDSTIEPSDLLIDQSAMPSNWYIVSSEENVPDDMRQETGASIWFNAVSDRLFVASHRVYQFRTEERAAQAFEEQFPIQFNDSSVAAISPWQPPAELIYASPIADQYYFGCHTEGINRMSEICQAMARYKNYLMIFHTHLAPEYMTYADVEKILEAIDDRALAYIAEGS